MRKRHGNPPYSADFPPTASVHTSVNERLYTRIPLTVKDGARRRADPCWSEPDRSLGAVDTFALDTHLASNLFRGGRYDAGAMNKRFSIWANDAR
jgi:hypothetical protein